ncbi:TetR/AcrR family transcriptional regulator [Pseudonocardia sp. HH130630-07]|uniref:TetR/AcrR family transcriptional regulator n=1 Tax=Pseudonocardia sp. HH130630-07 TaxID=1690815 RepID=UPI0008151A6F|nr:TetR/AcrR family transcriptional regulator [Pseudonocardia sp. HH130630-07]ANY06945.1 hypothetical protein AFB00_12310 [Pseudonocardia sp. HH130630-07]
MPKVVDHDARRRQIADAVCRIAAAEGLEAVSVRRVAGAAGLSSPLVQRYFPEKNEMLRFAITDVTARGQQAAQERVRALVARDPGASPVRTTLRAVLIECLPLDDERRLVLLVHHAYFSRALFDPAIASLFRDETPLLAGYVADELAGAQRSGQVDPRVDPRREADTLLCVAIELGTEMLLGTKDRDAVLDLLDYHLERLFTG